MGLFSKKPAAHQMSGAEIESRARTSQIAQSQKFAKEDAQRRQRELRAQKQQAQESRRIAEKTRRFNKTNEQLSRQNQIATQRANISKQEAARTAYNRKRMSGVSKVAGGVVSLLGGKPTRSKQARATKGRAIYVSTSHGLKKITADMPAYEQYASRVTPPPVQRVQAKEQSDDTPAAFMGL